MSAAEVIVVGNGIGGSTLTKELRRRGVKVLLVGSGLRSSRAAIALARPSYLHQPLRSRLMPALESLGSSIEYGAEVTSYQRPDADPRLEADWFAVEPLAPLLEPDVRAYAVDAEARRIRFAHESLVASRAVVWCDGEGSGSRTEGATLISYDPEALSFEGLHVHHVAPYKTMAGVTFGDVSRIGSSTGRDKTESRARAWKMLRLAIELGWTNPAVEWNLVEGHRVSRPEFLERTGTGAYRWGGFHRSGYALAPLFVAETADRILAGS